MAGIEVEGRLEGALAERADEVIGEEALAFVGELHERFGARREELLRRRAERRERFAAGESLDFLAETRELRSAEWSVAPAPPDLADRRVEITGPTDRKMVINALNSGARGFMADFEDSNSPLWSNMVGGQLNLADAIDGSIEFSSPEGAEYALGDEVATLHVRPRGLHLPERHLLFGGRPASGSLCDFGLYFFANARKLIAAGSGPYFYLPKLESHAEARLWNEVFEFSEGALGLEPAVTRATVLIETLPAAFEMDEILHELRERSAGLNAGRWDYMFSAIKCFRDRPEFVLPDRNAVTMTVPFMRAYTELLVKTCHRRGAHAIGGMAAFIPSRKDPEANRRALAKLREDKGREAGDGFDGSWVAHPDSVAAATEQFDAVLGERPNQLGRLRDDIEVTASELLDIAATPAECTLEGLQSDVNVAIQYISSWLRGNGAAAIHGLMEDAATAEIARSQVWQWIRHEVELDDGRTVTPELVREIEDEQLASIRAEIDDDEWFETQGRPEESRALFERVALDPQFVEFLTLPAYDFLLERVEGAGS